MNASSQPTMAFEGLHRQYGMCVLLEISRLALSVGYTIVITGASGVSRTTLLCMLAGPAPTHGATIDLGRGQQALLPYPAELHV